MAASELGNLMIEWDGNVDDGGEIGDTILLG